MKLLFAVLLFLGLFNTDRYVINEPTSKTKRQTIICPGQSFKLGDNKSGDCLADTLQPSKQSAGDHVGPKQSGKLDRPDTGKKKEYKRKSSNPEIEKMIIEEANRQGYADIKFALDLADCESTFRPDAKNVNKDGTVDLGVFQINQYWHKIGRTCSLDAKCNIQYAISKLKAGGANLWSCTKKVRA